VSRPWWRSCSTSSASGRLLRAEGRAAGARDQAARRATSTSRRDRGLPDGARARRAGALEPQRLPERRRARAGRSASRARCAARPVDRRRRARQRRQSRRARGGSSSATRSSPSTSRSSIPRRSCRSSASSAGADRRRRARRPRAPDRQPDRNPGNGVEPSCATHDAQVEDPPRDGDRLRPALRRLDHDRPRCCSRPPTSCRTSRSPVVDVDNGARFETYTIAGERGAARVKLNGAAARLVARGDTDHRHLLRAVHARARARPHQPRVVHVDTHNRIVAVDERADAIARGLLGCRARPRPRRRPTPGDGCR
jgi:hypothetical protein